MEEQRLHAGVDEKVMMYSHYIKLFWFSGNWFEESQMGSLFYLWVCAVYFYGWFCLLGTEWMIFWYLKKKFFDYISGTKAFMNILNQRGLTWVKQMDLRLSLMALFQLVLSFTLPVLMILLIDVIASFIHCVLCFLCRIWPIKLCCICLLFHNRYNGSYGCKFFKGAFALLKSSNSGQSFNWSTSITVINLIVLFMKDRFWFLLQNELNQMIDCP